MMVKPKENLTLKTIQGSFWSLSSNLLGRFGALIFTIILARFLLPEGFGIYSLTTSISLIFLTLADLGINQTYIKYVSNSLINKRLSKAYFNYIFKIKIWITIIITLVILIISYPLSFYVFHKPELLFPMLISSIFVFLFSIESFFESTLYIFHKTLYLNFKEAIYQVSRIILSLLFFYVIAKSYYVSGVILSLTISMFFIMVYVIYYSIKFGPFIFDSKVKTNGIKLNKKEILSFLLYLTIGGISGVFFSYIDTVILGIYLPSAYVGFYRAAYTLIFGISGIFAFQSVFMAIFSQSNKTSLANNFNKVLKYLLLLSIPLCLGLFYFSNQIIRIVYGSEYLPAIAVFRLLSFLIIPAVLINLLIPLLASFNKNKVYAKAIVYGSIINIVLNISFIIWFLKYSQLMATFGAGLATLISTYLYVGYLFFYARYKLNIFFNMKQFLPFIISSILMIFIIYICDSLFSFSLYVQTSVLVIIGALSYILLLILFRSINIHEFYHFFKMLSD